LPRGSFILDQINVDPDVRLRLVVDTCCTNHGADLGTSGPISFMGLFNEEEILAATTSGVDGQEEIFTSDAFTAADVSASTGENIITIERPVEGGGNWMQFDQIRLEVDTDSLACAEPICSFTGSVEMIDTGGMVDLSWITDPSSTLEIDNGVGNVDGMTTGGVGTIQVFPIENTTYTMTSTRDDDVETAEVTVIVTNIISFDSQDVEVTLGNTTMLNWSVDPSASVSIEPGVGNVDNVTFNGMGSIEVTPGRPSTTYTLTSTRGADEEMATVTVGANNFECLWQAGVNDGGSGDLVQENNNTNPAPGDALARDDDWYFAGVYPDPIGIVARMKR